MWNTATPGTSADTNLDDSTISNHEQEYALVERRTDVRVVAQGFENEMGEHDGIQRGGRGTLRAKTKRLCDTHFARDKFPLCVGPRTGAPRAGDTGAVEVSST